MKEENNTNNGKKKETRNKIDTKEPWDSNWMGPNPKAQL